MAYYNRASLYTVLKNHQAAINDYSQILTVNPQDLEAHISRGQIRCQLKDFKGAIADANAVITFEPRSSEAYSFRAYSLRSEARQAVRRSGRRDRRPAEGERTG